MSSDYWKFSYPIGVDGSLYTTCPEINNLNDGRMESARKRGLYKLSCSYETPRVDRRPTALLIKELILLLQCPDAVIRAKANLYLKEWLALHPPTTTETIKLYSDAFSLNANNTFLIDTVKSCMENLEHFVAVWLVEFCVKMFQINFDYCLMQGSKEVLQSCMVTKWLEISPDSVFKSNVTSQLLDLLENSIIGPKPNVPLCVALSSLISMAAECVRLASVQWNPQDHNFVTDPALAISRDLAERIEYCRTQKDFDTAALVICSVQPCWLRTLVIAVILSSYTDIRRSEKIRVNEISLSSIVSQYFFLVPPLQGSSAPSTPSSFTPKRKKIKENKLNNYGESQVHIACKRNNASKLQELLAVPGVDINLKDNNGWTPLHEACNHGSYDCVVLLLNYVPNTTISSVLDQGDQTAFKLDLTAPGPNGVTPLIDAVITNRVEICRELLKYGGRQLLNARTIDGRTALDLAVTKEMREVLNDPNLSESTFEPDLLYDEIIGTSYVLQKDCHDFLSLLTSLVSSYYMLMSSQSSGNGFDNDSDISVLRNMKGHLTLLSRHIKRITKRKDYEDLLAQIELLELVCLSKSNDIF